MARRAVEVLDLDLGFNEIIKEISEKEKKQILIGVQAGSNTRTQTRNGVTQEAGQSIAEYASYNEFGTDKIPQRSFMRSTFDERLNEIEEVIHEQFSYVIERSQTIEQAYQRIGQAIQGMVQQKIREIRSPPNSPATVEKKKSSKPLIDFGQMIASIRYVVRKERQNE